MIDSIFYTGDMKHISAVAKSLYFSSAVLLLGGSLPSIGQMSSERPSQSVSSGSTKGSAQDDSANSGITTKSWTSADSPEDVDKGFLNRLKWQDHSIGGDYVLRTGKIFDKWVAATQFVVRGKVVLTEYTPPAEYVDAVDLINGRPSADFAAVDANRDGVLEIAFLHRKLNDPKYHMYTIYALEKDAPKLLWKSGGSLGDWLHHSDAPNSERWKAGVN